MRRHDVPDSQYIAAANGFPVAWIRYQNFTDFTVSGVLISDRYILSAAHTVRSGTHNVTVGSQTANIESWVAHPTWTANTGNPDQFFLGYDLSIARLDRRITQVAPLPFHTSTVPVGTAITVVGMGTTGVGQGGPGYQFPWNPIPSMWAPRAKTNIVDVDPAYGTIFLTDFDSPAGNSNSLSFLSSASAATALEGNLIWGDSGGVATAVFSGQRRIVGVNSSLGQVTDNGTVGDYGDISIFSRTSVANGWINANSWQAGRVDGRVSLQGFTGSPTQRTVTIQVRATGSTVSQETYTVPLAADGGFSFVTPQRGLRDLRFSIPGYQARVLRNVNITTTGPKGLSPFLPGGDVNADGEVDLTDIDVIIGNYLLATTDATLGDLNGDGEVDLTDLDLAIGNYLDSSEA